MLDSKSWIALGLAVALLFLAGLWHLMWIRAINSLDDKINPPHLSVIAAFWGIALLHLSEIAIGGVIYSLAVNQLSLGSLGQGYGNTAADFLYFSGITYTSMGYEHENVTGAVRLITMVNALAGLMLITWSATYVYSIWGNNFRDDFSSGDES